MSASWSTTDSHGKPLTDGRLCYVIRSDENPNMPPIYIYGMTVDEVLQKAAKTVETGQSTIHRMKSQPARPAAPAPAAPAVSPEQVATATADLSNPAKAVGATKVLLKAAGFDLDKEAMDKALRNVMVIAAKWEREHPDFPKDANDPHQRNERLLMDRASALAGGTHRVTADHLDAAFETLVSQRMFFDVAPAAPPAEPTVPARGSETPGTVLATSFRRNSLSSAEPAPVRRESDQVKEWRRIATTGTTRELRQAIESTPGFKKWMDEQFAVSA